MEVKLEISDNFIHNFNKNIGKSEKIWANL